MLRRPLIALTARIAATIPYGGVQVAMFAELKRNWATLKQGHPGSRFQDQHKRQRRAGETNVGRWLRIIAGTVIVLLGIFFLPAPGPGFIIIALGGALLAREFKFAARTLDWIEIRGRRAYNRVKRFWRRVAGAHRNAAR